VHILETPNDVNAENSRLKQNNELTKVTFSNLIVLWEINPSPHTAVDLGLEY